MNSHGHKANILYEKFKEIGVGVYKDELGQFWVVEKFLDNVGD
jgi:uncharacterized protein YkwD